MGKTLWDLPLGESATIKNLGAKSVMRRRLLDLGFVEGASVKKLLSAPAISAYLLRGAVIAIRRSDALDIAIET